MTVTRAELAALVESAFAAGPTTRDRMLAYATGGHARPEIIDLLRGLPDKSYPGLRDLWYELGHVPIGS